MQHELTARDVLTASAEYDHELTVRTIAPAVVLVLELEGPTRLELMASTESEHGALREWAANDPRAQHVLAAFFEVETDEQREQRHVERLEAGRRLSTLRVSDAAA